jgi:hypothetical protein
MVAIFGQNMTQNHIIIVPGKDGTQSLEPPSDLSWAPPPNILCTNSIVAGGGSKLDSVAAHFHVEAFFNS